MRTIAQIQKKIGSLKGKLRKMQLKENFGDKELRQLDIFIGSFWEYSYSDRQNLLIAQTDFMDWCGNYTGR